MQNKTVNIVIGILIAAAVICFVYIFGSSILSNKEKNKPKDEIEDVVDENEEYINERAERGQNVVLNSRIALPVKELIKYSEIYSNSIIDYLDKNGVGDEAKLLIGLDKIYRLADYNEYLRYSDEYNSTYIIPDEMNIVLKDSFADPAVKSKNVDEILNYDEATNAYVIVPRGFPTGEINYTYEIPYKITEFPDRLELLAYRLYAKKIIVMEEVQSNQKVELYLDKEQNTIVYTIENDSNFTDNNQQDYIRDKINAGAIDKAQLSEVKYTFEKVDNEYRISKFEKVEKTQDTDNK